MSNTSVNPELIEPTKAKLEAEAQQALANAEQARANARKAEAEAASAQEMLTAQRISTQMGQLQLAETKYQFEMEQARDYRHHTYWFNLDVKDSSVDACIQQLTLWDRMDETGTAPFTVIFRSPGGQVIPGMALFDFLRAMSAKGHEITTVVRGYAASMAGILLQAGDHRIIGPESYLMIHEISAGTGGKIGEIQDAVKFYEMLCERVVDIFVKRSGGKCTSANFKKHWTRIDWWLSSEDTVRYGFADEIA